MIPCRIEAPEYLTLADLTAFQGHLKDLPEEGYTQLRQSMVEDGFPRVVYYWAHEGKRYILDGHQALRVLEREGWQVEPGIPSCAVRADSFEQARRLVLKYASVYGKINPKGLKDFLDESHLDLTVFESVDLPDFDEDAFREEFYPEQADQGQTDPDAVPDLPPFAVTRPGDLWICGRHRVLCADCRSREDVERLLDGPIHLLLTDPPYNVDYRGKVGTERRPIEHDDQDPTDHAELLSAAFRLAWERMVDGAAAYSFFGDTEPQAIDAFRGHFHHASNLVWAKNSLVMGRKDYHWQHELILYGWKETGPHRWYGGRKQASIQAYDEGRLFVQDGDGWQIKLGDAFLRITGRDVQVEQLVGTVIEADRPPRSKEHPTMKPVALLERLIRNSSRPEEAIYDPFAGSGSTLIAAERLRRRAYLCELDPLYVDVILRRYQEFTGELAVHQDGRSFDQIAIERG